jgi:hypothetical protein
MASLRSLATRKAIFFDALIFTDSPVGELGPMPAARLGACRIVRSCRVPFPGKYMVNSSLLGSERTQGKSSGVFRRKRNNASARSR